MAVRCPACGTRAADDDRRCPRCRADLTDGPVVLEAGEPDGLPPARRPRRPWPAPAAAAAPPPGTVAVVGDHRRPALVPAGGPTPAPLPARPPGRPFLPEATGAVVVLGNSSGLLRVVDIDAGRIDSVVVEATPYPLLARSGGVVW